MSIGNYAIPADVAKEASRLAASKFHLTPPPGAARKKGVTRWNEAIEIESASKEEAETKAGDTHIVFTVNGRVLAGTGTPNESRKYTFSMRINYESLPRDAEDGQRKMSMGTINKLIQLAGAALPNLFDDAIGLTEELIGETFPTAGSATDMSGGSLLKGTKVVLVLKDNETEQFNGRNQQEVVAILPLTEE